MRPIRFVPASGGQAKIEDRSDFDIRKRFFRRALTYDVPAPGVNGVTKAIFGGVVPAEHDSSPFRLAGQPQGIANSTHF